ncbi:MAG: Vps62-related protein [Candidatus Bathyarchaeota archaeon]|nr:Vps62-related protein [Candidatus Bathyarchaeota archaeon]
MTPSNIASKKSTRRVTVAFCAVIVLASFFTLMAVQPFSLAQSNEDLAYKYAPVLHFTANEKFYPTTVDYFISNSVLKERDFSGSSVVDTSPKPETLGTYTQPNMFLDNTLSTFESITVDYAGKASSLGYPAYVHIVNEGGSTVIQYWLFYAYNNGPLNNHQGDWEVIQVFLDSSANPTDVLLSQHGNGENAVWNDVEKLQNHPVIYVAEGSHANYFRSFQGKIGVENDVVGNNGKTISSADLTLVMLGEPGNHPADQSWLDFPGRWGYWGTEEEIVLGKVGPYGPVYNQDGIRWAKPSTFMASTFSVDGSYFTLAWLAANFLLLFIIYFAARTAWKSWGIIKLHRNGGLRTLAFLKGRGGIGLILGVLAILVTLVALFLPWYSVTAQSETGALAQNGGVTLMAMDGVHGVVVNMFVTGMTSDAVSGYTNLFSLQIPFAIIFGVGALLLALDVVGVKSGRSMGKKFLFGTVVTLLPIIIILLFISQLPSFLPFAYGLFPGQSIPTQVSDMIYTIAGSPIQGTNNALMPIIGNTTVTWGLGVGAYLFILAAILRLTGGIIMYKAPELKKTPAQ